MKCNKSVICSSFKIDYSKELVKFKDNLFEKKKMGLKEFAIKVLLIEPVSIEVIAMYIGKLGFDVYNTSGTYSIMFKKKTRKGIKGRILINGK